MDTVFVRALTVEAILGILPHERERPQPVRISFAMTTDASRAARTDDIADAVDYAAAARRVTALTVEGRFRLVETLAEHIAQLLLHEFPVERVRVEVEKPAALPEAGGVGVAIERRRQR
ncbi:MAG TPA: dihydroneopterin aldolase [Pseudomonadales bacterium]